MDDEKDEKVKFGINKRPYLHEFLTELKKDFEIIAFTAGTEKYAEMIVSHLDPNDDIFDYYLSRNNCIQV